MQKSFRMGRKYSQQIVKTKNKHFKLSNSRYNFTVKLQEFLFRLVQIYKL